MTAAGVALPEIRFGDRFRISSKRGSQYTVTLLRVGDRESGLFVRLDDGRIARLEPAALRWDTYEAVAQDTSPVRIGDDFLVDATSGSVRGTLEAGGGARLTLRLPIGVPLALPTEDVEGCYLLFKARNLKPGDHVFVKSKSGNEYRGMILRMGASNSLKIELRDGGTTNLRLHKVDLSTLVVAIPLTAKEILKAVAG